MEPEVVTREQLWGGYEEKGAEATNSYDMPPTPPSDKRPSKHLSIPKTGAALDDAQTAVSGTQPASHPQAKPVNPRVDVSGKEPPKVIQEKSASRFALPSIGRYPLDAYSDVEKAAAYFDEHYHAFSPGHRHEFGVNLVKRASELGIPVGESALKHGSTKYASAEDMQMALDCRRSILQDDTMLGVLEALSKTAGAVDPMLFAATLAEFDKLAGLEPLYDGEIPDPYSTTFGAVKLAADEDGSTIIGNDVIYHKDLIQLAKTDAIGLKRFYGDAFMERFRNNPIGTFKSLPKAQQKVVGRLAAEPGETTGR